MAKIGILGGTFNPIHLGHIKLAQTTYEELSLDTVWFMPSKNPPHKDNNCIIAERYRLEMIKLAISEYKHFQVSDIELQRKGTTYTSYTLEYLNDSSNYDKEYSNNEYYFIVGADSLLNIESWNRPEVLFKLSNFVVACRDDVDITMLTKHSEYLRDKYNANIFIINMDKLDISSSYIRQCYMVNPCDFDYKNYLNDKVHQFIIKNDLYRK